MFDSVTTLRTVCPNPSGQVIPPTTGVRLNNTLPMASVCAAKPFALLGCAGGICSRRLAPRQRTDRRRGVAPALSLMLLARFLLIERVVKRID